MSVFNTNDLHRIFDKLDQNGDGFVSLDELKWLLKKIGIQTSPDELESLAGKTNLDILDLLFFYDTVIKQNFGDQSEEGENLESDLTKAFRVYDVNGDGVISCKELQNVLSRLGLWNEHYGRDCKSSMSDEYDMNSNGVLDFEEFKNMMLLSKS